jgi:hypothetical protein
MENDYTWEELEEAIKLMKERGHMPYDYDDRRHKPQVVQSTAVDIPQEVNILPASSRAGHADRDRTINHISQMLELGYLQAEEATKRINFAAETEHRKTLAMLTSDLPAPVDDRGWFASYDFDKPKYWVPTLVGGMAGSGTLAVVPTVMFSSEHVFHSAPFLAIGIITIIFGTIGWFACLAGIIHKA